MASGSLVVGSITAGNGALRVVVNGDLQVTAGSTLSANEANLILQDLNTTTGAITVGAGATLSATTSVKRDADRGNIYLIIGAIPASPMIGTTPANVTLSKSHGGKAFFGTNGITAQAPANGITANGGYVVFNTGTEAAGAINLGGGVTINSTAAPSAEVISLDLTNPGNVSALVQLQQEGSIGGTLIVSGGIAVGGNMIIDNGTLDPTLLAQNIPANVTLTLRGFQADSPIVVDTPVTINGTQEFVGAGYAIARGDKRQYGRWQVRWVMVGSTGRLTSDGGLTVTGNKAMTFNGLVSADTLSVSTTANNGNLTFGANVIGTTSVSLQANGSGNIVQTGGTISGGSVALSSGTGNLGTSSANVRTVAGALTVNTGGNGTAYITNTGATAVGASSVGGAMQLLNSGSIETTGAISAKNRQLHY